MYVGQRPGIIRRTRYGVYTLLVDVIFEWTRGSSLDADIQVKFWCNPILNMRRFKVSTFHI